MTQYVRGSSPIWFFNNLTGQTLDDTYYAFFLTNTMPYLPQAVYETPDNSTPWANPIEFQASGGLPNNIYGDDTLTYRIEIRQGPDQTYPLIWLIQNYTFGSGSSSSTTDTLGTAENMITNPQFADIYFTSPLAITTAGTYYLGPGWQLVLTGSGSTTVTQFPQSGNNNIAGNPAYYLEFNNNGWTTVQLIQQFSNNGAIFNKGAIGVAFSAFATTNAENVTVIYHPSTGTPQNILVADVLTGAFQQFGGAIDLTSSGNSDEGTAAYVNIIFSMPNVSDISISNI